MSKNIFLFKEKWNLLVQIGFLYVLLSAHSPRHPWVKYVKWGWGDGCYRPALVFATLSVLKFSLWGHRSQKFYSKILHVYRQSLHRGAKLKTQIFGSAAWDEIFKLSKSPMCYMCNLFLIFSTELSRVKMLKITDINHGQTYKNEKPSSGKLELLFSCFKNVLHCMSGWTWWMINVWNGNQA